MCPPSSPVASRTLLSEIARSSDRRRHRPPCPRPPRGSRRLGSLTIVRAPLARAAIRAPRPIGPPPRISTDSPGLHLAPLDGLDADRQGFAEGQLVVREVVRRLVQAIDGDRDPLGHAAIGVDAEHPDARAAVVSTLPAREAAATVQDGLDANPVARHAGREDSARPRGSPRRVHVPGRGDTRRTGGALDRRAGRNRRCRCCGPASAPRLRARSARPDRSAPCSRGFARARLA